MQAINGDILESGIIDGQRVERLSQGKNGKFYAHVQGGQRYAVDPEEFLLLTISLTQ